MTCSHYFFPHVILALTSSGVKMGSADGEVGEGLDISLNISFTIAQFLLEVWCLHFIPFSGTTSSHVCCLMDRDNETQWDRDAMAWSHQAPGSKRLTQPGRALRPAWGPADRSRCRQGTACTLPPTAALWCCRTFPSGTWLGPLFPRGSSGPPGTRWHQSLFKTNFMLLVTWTSKQLYSSLHFCL